MPGTEYTRFFLFRTVYKEPRTRRSIFPITIENNRKFKELVVLGLEVGSL